MFYRLVKRAVWDRGVPEYHFELMRYKRITSIGIYADGKCLKKAKKIDTIEKYCRRVGLPFSLVERDASCDFEY